MKKKILKDKDLYYLYLYIKFNYKKIKKFRNINILFGNNIEKVNFFNFVTGLDKDYLKKSNLIFIDGNREVNLNNFDYFSNTILNIEISKFFLEYLDMLIKKNKLFKTINEGLKGLYRKNLIYILIYFITAYVIVYLIGNSLLNSDIGVGIDMFLLEIIFEHNFLIQFSIFLLILFIFLMKVVKHFYFYDYFFSKIYVLLEYKIYFYKEMLEKLINKKNHIEVGYIKIKKVYYDFSDILQKYTQEDELINYQVYVNSFESLSGLEFRNKLLSQEIIGDIHLLNEYQKKNNKLKIELFQDTKDTCRELFKDLEIEYQTESEKQKGFFGLLLIYIYLYIMLLVLTILLPIILSLI